MSHDNADPRNLWSLTVLCLLQVRPMYPYEIQRLIREWGKAEFLDLRRGSLYNAIDRLRRASLIEVVKTTREGRRPERTVYRITAAGRREAAAWLHDMLARPAKEPAQFFAALSFLPNLSPEVVQKQLRLRAERLEEEVARVEAALAEMVPKIGRLVLIEAEYARAILLAELEWVRSLIDELKSGKLRWDPKELLRQAAEATKSKRPKAK